MRVLAATFAFNEGEKIKRTLARHELLKIVSCDFLNSR